MKFVTNGVLNKSALISSNFWLVQNNMDFSVLCEKVWIVLNPSEYKINDIFPPPYFECIHQRREFIPIYAIKFIWKTIRIVYREFDDFDIIMIPSSMVSR